jgi:hypothetical protein
MGTAASIPARARGTCTGGTAESFGKTRTDFENRVEKSNLRQMLCRCVEDGRQVEPDLPRSE